MPVSELRRSEALFEDRLFNGETFSRRDGLTGIATINEEKITGKIVSFVLKLFNLAFDVQVGGETITVTRNSTKRFFGNAMSGDGKDETLRQLITNYFDSCAIRLSTREGIVTRGTVSLWIRYYPPYDTTDSAERARREELNRWFTIRSKIPRT